MAKQFGDFLGRWTDIPSPFPGYNGAANVIDVACMVDLGDHYFLVSSYSPSDAPYAKPYTADGYYPCHLLRITDDEIRYVRSYEYPVRRATQPPSANKVPCTVPFVAYYFDVSGGTGTHYLNDAATPSQLHIPYGTPPFTNWTGISSFQNNGYVGEFGHYYPDYYFDGFYCHVPGELEVIAGTWDYDTGTFVPNEDPAPKWGWDGAFKIKVTWNPNITLPGRQDYSANGMSFSGHYSGFAVHVGLANSYTTYTWNGTKWVYTSKSQFKPLNPPAGGGGNHYAAAKVDVRAGKWEYTFDLSGWTHKAPDGNGQLLYTYGYYGNSWNGATYINITPFQSGWASDGWMNPPTNTMFGGGYFIDWGYTELTAACGVVGFNPDAYGYSYNWNFANGFNLTDTKAVMLSYRGSGDEPMGALVERVGEEVHFGTATTLCPIDDVPNNGQYYGPSSGTSYTSAWDYWSPTILMTPDAPGWAAALAEGMDTNWFAGIYMGAGDANSFVVGGAAWFNQPSIATAHDSEMGMVTRKFRVKGLEFEPWDLDPGNQGWHMNPKTFISAGNYETSWHSTLGEPSGYPWLYGAVKQGNYAYFLMWNWNDGSHYSTGPACLTLFAVDLVSALVTDATTVFLGYSPVCEPYCAMLTTTGKQIEVLAFSSGRDRDATWTTTWVYPITGPGKLGSPTSYENVYSDDSGYARMGIWQNWEAGELNTKGHSRGILFGDEALKDLLPATKAEGLWNPDLFVWGPKEEKEYYFDDPTFDNWGGMNMSGQNRVGDYTVGIYTGSEYFYLWYTPDVTGPPPPTRLNQRDDGLGKLAGHARMNVRNPKAARQGSSRLGVGNTYW